MKKLDLMNKGVNINKETPKALGTLFVLYASFNLQPLIAQESPHLNIRESTVNKVDLGMSPVLEFLGKRFNSLDIGYKAMQIQDSELSEMSYIATFSVSGALIYDEELMEANEKTIANRSSGLLVLPYTVTVTNDGRTFISISGWAVKDMIMKEKLDYDRDSPLNIDEICILSYEYDKNFTVEGIESHKLKIASLDTKFDILSTSKRGTFLALTAGGDFGAHKTLVKHNGHLWNINMNNDWGRDDQSMFRGLGGINASFRYGLEFQKESTSGWNINAKIGAEHIWSKGWDQNPEKWTKYEKEIEKYEAAQAEYVEKYDVYSEKYDQWWLAGQDANSEPEAPLAPTRPTRPKPGENRISRTQFFIVPTLRVSKNLAEEGKRPVRLGLGVYGNIPIKDSLGGFVGGLEDGFSDGSVQGSGSSLKGHNRELFGLKMFIKF